MLKFHCSSFFVRSRPRSATLEISCYSPLLRDRQKLAIFLTDWKSSFIGNIYGARPAAFCAPIGSCDVINHRVSIVKITKRHVTCPIALTRFICASRLQNELSDALYGVARQVFTQTIYTSTRSLQTPLPRWCERAKIKRCRF